MEKRKRISNAKDLEARIRELQLENDMFLSQMKSNITNVSSYLPISSLSEKLSLNSFASITNQLGKRGLTFGLLVPIILNNTIFKKKSKTMKAMVTALSLFASENVSGDDLKKIIKKFYKKKKKKEPKFIDIDTITS